MKGRGMKKPGIAVGLVSFHNGTIEIPRELQFQTVQLAAKPLSLGTVANIGIEFQESKRKDENITQEING